MDKVGYRIRRNSWNDHYPFLSEVGYRIRRNSWNDHYSIWRRAQSPPEKPYEEGGREAPICRIIENFKLVFVKKNDMLNSLTDAIPDAIVIEFTLNQDGERETFFTMVKPVATAVEKPATSSKESRPEG